jgi:hypothetical protein
MAVDGEVKRFFSFNQRYNPQWVLACLGKEIAQYILEKLLQ